jgi:hypothetical protein
MLEFKKTVEEEGYLLKHVFNVDRTRPSPTTLFISPLAIGEYNKAY